MRPERPPILRSDGCHTVPLNLLTRRTTRKPPRRKKITTQVWEGLPCATRVSVNPEPAAGRKLPAPLAFLFIKGTIFPGLCVDSSGDTLTVDRVVIGCPSCEASLGDAFLPFEACFLCVVGTGVLTAGAGAGCVDQDLKAAACSGESL
jgi:hypothetical protein